MDRLSTKRSAAKTAEKTWQASLRTGVDYATGTDQGLRKATEPGQLPDEKNPLFLFRDAEPQLLVRIILHGFDNVALARRELQSRGLNNEGRKPDINKQSNIAAVKKQTPGLKKRRRKRM